MRSTLTSREWIAEGTIEFKLSVQDQPIHFQAGQYAVIELINPPFQDNKPTKRILSIVNSENETQTLTFATRISDSGFKRSLMEIPLNTPIEINRIGGHFLLPPADKPIVFIAGGIGITPFISMLRTIKDQNLSRQITLFYSCKDTKSTAYLSELTDDMGIISNFKLIPIITQDTNWQGEKNKLDRYLFQTYLPQMINTIFMLVGPPGMMDFLTAELLSLMINNDAIITEKLIGY